MEASVDINSKGTALTPTKAVAASTVASDEQPERFKGMALLAATKAGDTKKVSSLIGTSVDINYSAEDGFTALALAARQGCWTLFQVLIDAGARTDQASADGFTPLIIAAQNGHINILSILVNKLVNVDQTSQSGSTALMWSSHTSHAPCVKELVEAGATVSFSLSIRMCHSETYYETGRHCKPIGFDSADFRCAKWE